MWFYDLLINRNSWAVFFISSKCAKINRMCGILVTRKTNNYVARPICIQGLINFIIKWRCEQWWYASHSAVRFDNIRPIIKKIVGFFFQCRTLHHSNISFPGRINYNAQIHTGKTADFRIHTFPKFILFAANNQHHIDIEEWILKDNQTRKI